MRGEPANYVAPCEHAIEVFMASRLMFLWLKDALKKPFGAILVQPVLMQLL